ncbi:MAG: hypothetical protein JXJ04_04730, partial [Spirochaetales bacterium]|nr:hypothetical protein [Spirochaetales bacterium]
MNINIIEASEHNLKKVSAQFTENLTVVTGVSGSGKSSLVFNTLYHESRRRFLDVFTHITTGMRMTPAKVKEISGLGPAIAIGQNLLNRNPHSTVATASGLHPFFRLLFARCGDQVCGTCGNPVHILSKDELTDRIYREAKQNQVKAYCLLVNRTKGSHRLLLSSLQHEFGTKNLIVDGLPPGNGSLMGDKQHTIELFLDTLDKSARTTSIRKLIQKTISLGSHVIIIRRKDDMTMLPFSSSCPFCGEKIITPEPKHFHEEGSSIAGSVRWQDRLFSEIMAYSVEQARRLFSSHKPHHQARRLYKEILKRLDALTAVGLSYLSLDRPSPTLSRGESQRVRIALSLISRLEDMIHILDEPTIGLHPTDVIRLMPVLRNLPGPVIFVEHDRIAAAYADVVYDLGPGAGRRGGEILFSGTPEDLWKEKSITGQYFSLNRKAQILRERPEPGDFIRIKGAYCHNLKEISAAIPLQRLTVVTGVSGSGKSSLVHHVLASTLIKKRPDGCSGFDGPYIRPVHVDQSPIGLNPRSNPATYTGLAAIIRDMFAGQTGLSPSLFSFNRPDGACMACNGMGAIEVSMKYLPSEWIPCSACNGRRFTDSVLEQYIIVQEKKFSIADMYDMEIGEVFALFQKDHEIPDQFIQKMEPILRAFMDIGLGYITLGQPSPTLSGGEAQRVKLVKFLAKKNLAGKMIILDEPSTGLHPHDVNGLLTIIDRLIRYKATLIVVEHNTDIIDAADWIIDLGPGAGPEGGSLLFQGPGKEFKEKIHKAKNFFPAKNRKKKTDNTMHYITVKGAAIHNLKDLNVRIPKNKLTVITGVSGSGKSSLLQDILESEAKRRFYETLSMYERQGIKEGANADVEEVSGLGISLFPGHEKNLYDRRSTVGTITECIFHLAVLFSQRGIRDCPACATPMKRVTEERVWSCTQCGSRIGIPNPEYFISTTYGAACTECHGMGTISIPAPEKLIINPGKPLCGGAMYSPGFFPNGYFGKEFNNGHYMLLALSKKYGFDPFSTPWKTMTPAARHAFLYGDDEPLEVAFYNKKGYSGTKKIPFPGFYSLVLDWDFGGTFCTISRCPGCKGTRLRKEFLSVKINGYNIYQMNEMEIS